MAALPCLTNRLRLSQKAACRETGVRSRGERRVKLPFHRRCPLARTGSTTGVPALTSSPSRHLSVENVSAPLHCRPLQLTAVS